ncbi:Zinc finger, C6HC-type [Artemisia annua]|uniref:RBR-type E3 ubiquitin transferase n=1 Tax=Artemisia annua TaxID=35608 RepID=A0A2U1MQQ8_ARTAN|nr:Zinc finger, C6HC-type [Artemisia annua]
MCSNLDHDLQHTLNITSDEEYDGDEVSCSNSYASDDDCIRNLDDSTDDDINVPTNENNSSVCYLILKEDDLIQRQQREIDEVTSVLSVSNDYACMLLLKYSWSVSKIHEAWFGDEVKVCESVGLLDVHHDVKFPKTDVSKVDCGICFESVMVKDTANCGCGHAYCKVCWRRYVSYAIKDGPCCMTKKCPEPSCRAAVSPGMVNLLVEGKQKKKYDMFWFRSYVELNEKIKWCPGPGCNYAVEFNENYDFDNYDVTCDCKFVFCWKCMEDDAHSPLDCETVGKWMLKNKDEAENTTWILAYTKPCPKCMKSIEKNEGCMHMTCRCGHEFCWLCLGPWGHGPDRACNGFRSEGGEVNKEEQQRDLAKKSIQRYTHYYERWAANEKSRKKALSDLHKIETVELKILSSNYDMTEKQLQFIKDAWLQIVECRRMLKWTYAYGFYIPEKEKEKKAFFEFLQGEAEVGLERLHLCAEKGLQIYIKREDEEATTKVIFNSFRIKLTGLTDVTRSYFQNLVRALENGLSEVDYHGS